MIEPIVKALGRIESLLARSINAPAKHGKGVPPWHMWGNSQIVENAAGTPGELPTTGQLLRVSYARPESWHFILAAALIEAPTGLAPGTQAFVSLRWNLTLGVGRSVSTLSGFELFDWQWAAPNPPPLVQIRSSAALQPTTRMVGNPLVDPTNIRATQPDLITQVVAENIQLDVLCQYFTNPLIAGAGTSVKLAVDALFAPKVHVRPEWHLHTFPGGEEG